MRQHIQGEVRVRETLHPSGDDTTYVEPIDSKREVHHMTHEDGSVLHPFVQDTVRAYHPVHSDTVKVNGRGWAESLGLTCRHLDNVPMILVRDKGLIHVRFVCGGSVYAGSEGRLELLEFQSSTDRP
jgi:hypothetical protein